MLDDRRFDANDDYCGPLLTDGFCFTLLIFAFRDEPATSSRPLPAQALPSAASFSSHIIGSRSTCQP